MRNGWGLAALFLGSVATSVVITRLLSAGAGEPASASESRQPATSPLAGDRSQKPPAVSQRDAPATERLASVTPSAVVGSTPVDLPPATEGPPGPDLEKQRFDAEQRFELDSPPDSRARSIERDMRHSIERTAVEGVDITAVDCKRTTCRAVITSNTKSTNEQAIEKLAEEASGPFADFGFTVPAREANADGSVRTVMFIKLN